MLPKNKDFSICLNEYAEKNNIKTNNMIESRIYLLKENNISGEKIILKEIKNKKDNKVVNIRTKKPKNGKKK